MPPAAEMMTGIRVCQGSNVLEHLSVVQSTEKPTKMRTDSSSIK